MCYDDAYDLGFCKNYLSGRLKIELYDIFTGAHSTNLDVESLLRGTCRRFFRSRSSDFGICLLTTADLLPSQRSDTDFELVSAAISSSEVEL